MSAAATRPWPTPARGERSLIIRDPARFARVSERAGEGDIVAIRRIDRHHIAVAANLHLGAALQRWRNSVREES